MSDQGFIDPVCGKSVQPLRARAVGIFGGRTYYFCSTECKARFADPRRDARPEVQPVEQVPAPEPAAEPPAPPRPERPQALRIEIPPEASPARLPMKGRAVRRVAAGLVMMAVSVGAAWQHFHERIPIPSTPSTRLEQSPPPVPTTQSMVVASSKRAVDVAASSPTGAATPASLELGMRWSVERGTSGMQLVERLLVVDATQHATVYEVARCDTRGDLTTRDGSAQLAIKAPFAAPTAELGTIYEDEVVLGGAHFAVRLSHRPGVLLGETRSTEAGAWRTTLNIPVSMGMLVRGGYFARERYDSAPRGPATGQR
jgi:YHS domain-containing protein